jgi:phage-related protein
MKSAIEDVAIEIGSQLAPKLEILMEKFGPIIEQAAPVMVDLFEKLWTAIEALGTFLQPLLDKALPALKTIFENLKEPVEKVLGFLATLGETVLKTVVDLITNEEFQQAAKDIGDSIGEFATSAKKLLESDLAQFLLDVSSKTVIRGLRDLGEMLAKVSATLFALNTAMDLLSGKKIDASLTTSKLLDGLQTVTGVNFRGIIEGITKRDLPQFAEGGIVMPRAGGTMGVIGEAGQAEAVIPLDRLESMMSGNGVGSSYNITINAGVGSDPVSIGRYVTDAIKRYESVGGKVFARA